MADIKNEILNEEQLDSVAGGTYLESADDAKKFQALGIKIYDTEIVDIPVLTHDEFVKLRNAFDQYGVKIEDHGGLLNANKYFIGGKEVSREDAWKHINAQFSK